MHEDSYENPPLNRRPARSYLYLVFLLALSAAPFASSFLGPAPVASYKARNKTPAIVASAQPKLRTVVMHMVRADETSIPLTLELALGAQEQEQGLMFRTEMEAGEGMLFAYSGEASRQMWMKNTALPLDMLFLDGHGAVIDIAANTTPYSEAVLTAARPAQAVLELRGGVAAAYRFASGDHLAAADWQSLLRSLPAAAAPARTDGAPAPAAQNPPAGNQP